GLEPDVRPVGFERLREQHGYRRGHALAHLGAVDHDKHTLVGTDAQPRIGRERCRGGGASTAGGGQVKADDETGTRDARRLEELASGDFWSGAHVTLPARRGGWRRGY